MKIAVPSWIAISLLLLLTGPLTAYAESSKWLQLDADSKERLRHIIQSDIERRRGFTTPEEARRNTDMVERERDKERSAYMAQIDAASADFKRTKKRLDDLSAQFQTASYDFEETKKNHDTMKAGIDNMDNSIARYQEDIRSQREALKKWLKTTKQGETLVAVIYTRGFMDSAHKLERLADQASAPLMAEHMGTYIQSFSKVVNNVLTGDFIRAVEEGTAKWNREEPVRIALTKGSQGTTYLRVKRYELYPFQAPDAKQMKANGDDGNIGAKIIESQEDLTAMLKQNGYSPDQYDLSRVSGMIRDIALANRQAEANQREQLISFQERITYLEKKIESARNDKASLLPLLNAKSEQLEKMASELEVIRLRKESAASAFQNAQTILLDKKRVHESIIIKTSLVTVKRSETPAEASAEAVLEELKDVLNDARMQHYSSTTDVLNGSLIDESKRHAISEAKIIAVRPLAFINEGESIRVKIAFRVKTVLDTNDDQMMARVEPPEQKPAIVAPQPEKKKAEPSTEVVKRKDQPKTSVKTPSATIAAVQQKSAPSTTDKPVMTGSALDFHFELDKVVTSAKTLTFLVKATNRAQHVKYLAFFDQTSGYGKSTISGSAIATSEVYRVNFWQGRKKTASADAYRGVPVNPGDTVVVELIFNAALPANTLISRLNLLPSVGTRSIIRTYSWRSEDIPFKDIRVPH